MSLPLAGLLGGGLQLKSLPKFTPGTPAKPGWRGAAGISREELAFRAGIDRTYASQIERAIANPSLGITCAVADALGCPLIDLLTARGGEG